MLRPRLLRNRLGLETRAVFKTGLYPDEALLRRIVLKILCRVVTGVLFVVGSRMVQQCRLPFRG